MGAEILRLKQKLIEKQRLEELLAKARKSFAREVSINKSLAVQLDKEGVDVKELESRSLAAIFYSIIGKKETRLEIERKELLEVQIKYDNSSTNLAMLEKEIRILENKIRSIGNVHSRIKMIISEREHILKEKKHPEYLETVNKIAELKSEAKEYKEAVSCGKKVLAETNKMIKYLESAGDWGVIDVLGGGLITTSIKYSKIDCARRSANRVHRLLERFHRELTDIRDMPYSTSKIDIGSIETFMDYFFDGFIVDWIVLSKINTSIETSRKTRKTIKRILKMLDSRLNKVKNRIKKLRQQKTLFLENF